MNNLTKFENNKAITTSPKWRSEQPTYNRCMLWTYGRTLIVDKLCFIKRIKSNRLMKTIYFEFLFLVVFSLGYGFQHIFKYFWSYHKWRQEYVSNKLRMKTFIKEKLKSSDGQTNICKYRVVYIKHHKITY